jgi:hypothetical protein
MTEPISDERVRFYVERRVVIDEWIAAAAAEHRAAVTFLEGVATGLATEVKGWGLDAEVYVYRSKTHAGLFLPDWAGPDGLPRAFVGFGWVPKEVRFEGEDTAFVGVRARRSASHATTREIIQEVSRSFRRRSRIRRVGAGR